MDARSTMPELAYPFAVVGAAAGWLSVGFLDNPLLYVTPSHAGVLAGACTAIVAGLVGARLTRKCAPGDMWASPSAPWVRLVVAVLFGGVVSGGIIGGFAFQTTAGVGTGVVAGFWCGLAFLPVCALVLAAARRAARARLGSIVAGSDRRAMWGIMVAALAVTTLAGVPDWLTHTPPIVALALALAALASTLGLMSADALARRRVSRAAREGAAMELRENPGEHEPPGEAVPQLDLGLGDEVRAQLTRGAAAYRGRDRAVALLVGSPEHARAAIQQAIVKKAVGLAVIGAVLGAHLFASLPASALAYHLFACHRGSNLSCGLAAAQLEADEVDLAHARELRDRACSGYGYTHAASCGAIAAQAELEVPLPWHKVLDHREKACFAGDGVSCRVLARHLRAGIIIQPDPGRADLLLQQSCERGEPLGCEDLREKSHPRF